jgi:2Fe-2S ferredoxin
VTRTAIVTVEPWGITFDVGPDETVFDAAYRNGWQWPTNCYGQCRCTVCHVLVVEGAESLDAPGDAELAVLEPLHRTVYAQQPDAVLRLACQIRPHADLCVTQRRQPRPRPPAPTSTRRGPNSRTEPDFRTESEVTNGQH